MGYRGKSDKEYQRNYYYKNREQRLSKMRQYNNKNYEIIHEYQREYYLRNRDEILLLRTENYINKKQERNKNENNVVIVSKEMIISILEN
jgi:hypothetical protein